MSELDKDLLLAEKRCKAAKESDDIAVPKIKFETPPFVLASTVN